MVEYDKNIEDVDNSILSIPPLATVITIAWATGADVYLETIDNVFLNSLMKVESIFKDWFPQFEFSTKIHVKNIVSNKIDNSDFALFFTGGVDSLSSYIRNKENIPSLVYIWGADIPLNEYKFWKKVKNQLTNFAKNENIQINLIKTNAREIVDNELLGKEYGNIEGGWWQTVSFGLVLTGLTAPLQNFGTLLMASSFEEFERRDGSHFLKFVDLSWADVKVKLDGDLNRHDKIKYDLKNNSEYYPYLRVCWRQYEDFNCGVCEKCLRTIVGLILEDIDPKDCKFEAKEDVLDLIRNYFENNLFDLEYAQLLFWQEIQDNIPNKLNTNLYNSNEFFEWFKDYNLKEYEYKGNGKVTSFLQLYYLARYYGTMHTTKRIFSILVTKVKIQ